MFCLIAGGLRVLRLCPTTRPRPLPDPHLYQYFIYIRNIQIAFIIFLLVLRLLAGIDLRGQVDRAPAWSITSGDWFSDC